MYSLILERLIVATLVLFQHKVMSTVTTCGTCDVGGPLPQFDDKKVSDFPIRIVHGLEALWECTRRCWDDSRCRSYSYNSLTRVCATFAVGFSDPGNTYNAITTETGWQLYPGCGRDDAFGTQCTVDTDCNYVNGFCKNGRCECSVGYSYDPNSGSCVIRCTTYSDVFVEYLNHAISYSNTIELDVASVEECINLCKIETTIVCANAEFRLSNLRCNLVNTTWYEAAPSKRLTSASDWSLFNRHCAINS